MSRDRFINFALCGAAAGLAFMILAMSSVSPHDLISHPGKLVVLLFGGSLLIICLGGALFAALTDEQERKAIERRKKMVPLVGMAGGALVFAICVGWYFWPVTTTSAHAATPSAATTQLAAGPSATTGTGTAIGSAGTVNIYPSPPRVPRNPPAPSRDPDTIYQRGRAVGQVIAPRIDRGNSTITFDALVSTEDLDQSKPFEYRNDVIKITRVQKVMGSQTIVTDGHSSFQHGVLQDVTCTIIGPRKQ